MDAPCELWPQCFVLYSARRRPLKIDKSSPVVILSLSTMGGMLDDKRPQRAGALYRRSAVTCRSAPMRRWDRQR